MVAQLPQRLKLTFILIKKNFLPQLISQFVWPTYVAISWISLFFTLLKGILEHCVF